MFITNHNRFPADMWLWVFLVCVMTCNYLFNQRHGALLDTPLKTEEWLIISWPHWLNWLYSFFVEQYNEYTAAQQVISVVSGLAPTERSHSIHEHWTWLSKQVHGKNRFSLHLDGLLFKLSTARTGKWITVFNSRSSFPRALTFKYCVLKSPTSLSFSF